MTSVGTLADRIEDAQPSTGFVKRIPIPLQTIRDATGQNLTGSTTPIIELSSAAFRIRWAASDSAAVNISIPVPGDYLDKRNDPDKSDHFKIILLVAMGGGTDAPTILADGVRHRAAETIDALDADASAAVSGTPLQEVECDLSRQDIRSNDAVTINLTPGAHTTDALLLYGAWFEYRSGWTMADQAKRDAG